MRAEIAFDQRQMALSAIDRAFVGDHAKCAVLGFDLAFTNAHNGAFMAQPVADQLGDGQNLQPVFLTEGNQVGNARHASVVLHHLADDGGGVESGHARQVYRGLRLSTAHQHTALARTQREDVAGTRQVGRRRGWCNGRLDRVCAIKG